MFKLSLLAAVVVHALALAVAQHSVFVRDNHRSRKQQPARNRIVRSAGLLVRERGVHGVGLREIVAHAAGPRGSLQRYFPGGKTQLVTEALDIAAAELSEDVESKLIEATSLPDAIEAIFAPWRQLLVEGNFTMGCPVAATVVDASGDDQLREKARALFAEWHDSVRDVLVRFGVQKSTADDDASVLLAAIEGALIFSRAQQSADPLDTVQRFFTMSLTRAAAIKPVPARRSRKTR
ncbi:MAG: TetR/AcrR family transcriptional regulator [Actinomycetota bacterium]|nr:TetR/AcrR family transcriptional regulator [Actinomycetota bacterium]